MLLERLYEEINETPNSKIGHYDPITQTWSHRESDLMSPQKHNREY